MLKVAQIAAAIAVIALFLSLAGIAYLSSPPSGNLSQQQSAPETKNGKQPDEQRTFRGFIHFLFPDSISFFTFWLMMATVILGIVAVVQIGYLSRSENISADAAKAAKESADVARDTLIAANRPWISLNTAIDGNLVFDEKGGHITFGFVFQNKGNTPATNLQFDAKIYLHTFGKDIPPPSLEHPLTQEVIEAFDPTAMLQKMAREMGASGTSMRKNDFLMGDTIFQGDAVRRGLNMAIEPADLQKAVEGRKDRLIFPFLIVCADYGFPFSETDRQTGMIYILSYADGKRNIEWNPGAVSGRELALFPQPFRSGLAN